MSKITLYREIILNLEDEYADTESLKTFVKDYVNNITILPKLEDALEYITKNYKPPAIKGQNNHPFAYLGVPELGTNNLESFIMKMINKKKT